MPRIAAVRQHQSGSSHPLPRYPPEFWIRMPERPGARHSLQMPEFYPLVRPLLRHLRAEAAHDLTIWALEAGWGRLFAPGQARRPDAAALRQRILGLDFPNPVGLAAGFDKDARVPDRMWRFGFGFVEIGTVTPRPQPGNPKPRVFRLEADGAVINRMGFNGEGLDRVSARLEARRGRPGIVGVNLGRNRDSADAAADYEAGVRRLAGLADYFVVNVSSPNTPGLRDLQRRAPLEALLCGVLAARDAEGCRAPLLVKIAPDLTREARADVAAVALDTGIGGIIVSNTTVERPQGLVGRHARRQQGGLSGRPLFAMSTELLADMHRLTGGRLPLVGVGGIASAADAYAKIRAGASLVQLYTALVFAGPALVDGITRGLAELLRADGFASVSEAVGTAYPAGQTRTAENAQDPRRPSALAPRPISRPAG
jgi:dihydroorotate dehydrogenase